VRLRIGRIAVFQRQVIAAADTDTTGRAVSGPPSHAAPPVKSRVNPLRVAILSAVPSAFNGALTPDPVWVQAVMPVPGPESPVPGGDGPGGGDPPLDRARPKADFPSPHRSHSPRSPLPSQRAAADWGAAAEVRRTRSVAAVGARADRDSDRQRLGIVSGQRAIIEGLGRGDRLSALGTATGRRVTGVRGGAGGGDGVRKGLRGHRLRKGSGYLCWDEPRRQDVCRAIRLSARQSTESLPDAAFPSRTCPTAFPRPLHSLVQPMNLPDSGVHPEPLGLIGES